MATIPDLDWVAGLFHKYYRILLLHQSRLKISPSSAGEFPPIPGGAMHPARVGSILGSSRIRDGLIFIHPVA